MIAFLRKLLSGKVNVPVLHDGKFDAGAVTVSIGKGVI